MFVSCKFKRYETFNKGNVQATQKFYYFVFPCRTVHAALQMLVVGWWYKELHDQFHK